MPALAPTKKGQTALEYLLIMMVAIIGVMGVLVFMPEVTAPTFETGTGTVGTILEGSEVPGPGLIVYSVQAVKSSGPDKVVFDIKLKELLSGIDFNGNGYDIYIRAYYIRGNAPCHIYTTGYQDFLAMSGFNLLRTQLVGGGDLAGEVGEYHLDFTHTRPPFSCFDFTRGYVVRVQSKGQAEYHVGNGRTVYNGTPGGGFHEAIQNPIPFQFA